MGRSLGISLGVLLAWVYIFLMRCPTQAFMSDDVTADYLGGILVNLDVRLDHFRKSQEIWEGFNGAESFVSQFSVEWQRVLE